MKKLILTAVSMVLALHISLPLRSSDTECAAGRAGGEKTVIVDTDMGMDDARAILVLTGLPGIRLAAVITTGGSASAAKAADNVIGLLESSGSGYVPVIRGMPAGLPEPPPWRPYAETMGGHPFPPPRTISQQELAGAAESDDGLPKGIWLVLGPLTSLAAIEDIVPGTLQGAEIWMPATVEGNRASGWNIGCDPEAARRVLDEAGRVFIVDVPADLDAQRILRDVEGDAPAARWIDATMGTESAAHAFLFDELAAAAIAAPHIFRISGERYGYSGVDGETVSLERSGEGRISIVRLEDEDALEPLLHGAWELRPGGHHELENHGVHHQAGSADPLERMKEFHGHLGPYVVLGYRMGMIALERTGSSGHFEISAEVHSVLRPPRSCLIDGVQLGSGCTLGKRNITIEETAGPPFVIFSAPGDEKVMVRLLPGIPAMLKESIDSIGVEATGRAVWDMDADSLFETTSGR